MDVPGVSPKPLRGLALPYTCVLALALAAALAIIPGCSSSSAPAGEDPAEVRGAEIADKMLAAYRDARSYTDSATYVQSYSYRGEGVERELPFFEMSLAFISFETPTSFANRSSLVFFAKASSSTFRFIS